MSKTICLYKKGKIRWIAPFNLLINKNTPRGDPADLYERKPYGGKRLLGEDELLGKVVEGEFKIHDCLMSLERLEAIKSLGIPICNSLFHNGSVYTTIKSPFKSLKQSLRGQQRNKHATNS